MWMTEGMNTEEIIELAKSRPEPVWHWGDRLLSDYSKKSGLHQKIFDAAEELNLELFWGEPIRPGDTYLAGRNGDPELLTCLKLGDGMVFSKEPAYSFDFNECVLVREKS